MDSLSNGFVNGEFSRQLGIPRGPVLVAADRPASGMYGGAVDLGMGIALPKYSRAGSSHRVSGESCLPVQFFEVRRVAWRSSCRHTWALGHWNYRGQPLR